MLGTGEITRLVPHQGRMCLLDSVVRWDEASIVCRALSHREPANPLREGAFLPAHAGIEYGAQAMALHGALSGGMAPGAQGYLAAVRDVRLHVQRLDDIAADLEVMSEKLAAEGARLLYRFAISAGERELLSGRVAVVLRGGAE